MEDGATLQCEGRPSELCRFVRYNLVQEQANTNWSATNVGRFVVTPTWNTSPEPRARFRFTDWSMPADGQEHFFGDYSNPAYPIEASFVDCQFHGGRVFCDYPVAVAFTNCLFNRTAVAVLSVQSDYRNNTFFGGSWAVPDRQVVIRDI